MRKVRDISEVENFRAEPWGPDSNLISVRRDFVEPEPVGTIVAMMFKVTGYDKDCDGSAMARFAAINRNGEESGWCPDSIGLYPDSDVVLTYPGLLHDLVEKDVLKHLRDAASHINYLTAWLLESSKDQGISFDSRTTPDEIVAACKTAVDIEDMLELIDERSKVGGK